MKKYFINAFVIIAAISAAYFVGSSMLYNFVFVNYSPQQPINFSHKIHAGKNEIPCLFCHIFANKSNICGVPSVKKCVGCHNSVKRESPEIKKIFNAWTTNSVIKWVRVHDLPDYIYFTHKRHVKANVKCQECHGPIQTMDRVYKYSSLGMGWCISCHKKRNGPTDCMACHK